MVWQLNHVIFLHYIVKFYFSYENSMDIGRLKSGSNTVISHTDFNKAFNKNL